MSVGHAENCKIKVTNTKKKNLFGKTKYTVTINLSDTYDFDEFNPKEQGFILSAINNGFGYNPMKKWGVLVEYDWRITYTFNYYY